MNDKCLYTKQSRWRREPRRKLETLRHLARKLLLHNSSVSGRGDERISEAHGCVRSVTCSIVHYLYAGERVYKLVDWMRSFIKSQNDNESRRDTLNRLSSNRSKSLWSNLWTVYCRLWDDVGKLIYMEDWIKISSKLFSASLTEYSVIRIHRDLSFGRVTDQPFGIRERDIARCRPVSLVVGNNFNFPMLKNTHARVRGAQIDPDCWCSWCHCLSLRKETGKSSYE